MRSLNKVIVIGNLTRDAELRYTLKQEPLAVFTLAVDSEWENEEGKIINETCFIVCELLGRRVQAVRQYLKKGQRLLIEGKLRLEKWGPKRGEQRSRHVIVVENVIFWGSANAQDRDSATAWP